jgi:hypothetical protein
MIGDWQSHPKISIHLFYVHFLPAIAYVNWQVIAIVLIFWNVLRVQVYQNPVSTAKENKTEQEQEVTTEGRTDATTEETTEVTIVKSDNVRILQLLVVCK